MTHERAEKFSPAYEKEHGKEHCQENRLCRECGESATGKRRSWCSDECKNRCLIRSFPSRARQAVRKRDRGVCAICGMDTKVIAKVKSRAIKKAFAFIHEAARNNAPVKAGRTIEQFVRQALKSFGMETWWRRKTFWDADHILPVSAGGGGCGLENFQTLCLRCHNDKTGRQHRGKVRKTRL